MPQNQDTHPEGQEPKDGEEAGAEAQAAETQTQASEEGEQKGETSLWDGIPDDHPVRAEVANLRKENAAKRTSAQQVKQENEQLQQSLKEAKTSEEVETLISEWQAKVSSAEIAATRERIGRRHKLPDEFVELLKGETEEELDEHGKTLKGLLAPTSASPPPAPPRGGKTPNDDAVDSKATLAEIKANRR